MSECKLCADTGLVRCSTEYPDFQPYCFCEACGAGRRRTRAVDEAIERTRNDVDRKREAISFRGLRVLSR